MQGVGYNNSMGKTKKLALHSPENPRRLAASDSGGAETVARTGFQYFGTPLVDLLKLENTEVPHLVVKACFYIYEHGINETGIFRVNGNVRVVESLKASFNRTGDADFEGTGDVMSVASLLKMFLRELPDGLISEELTKDFIKAQIANNQPQTQLQQFCILLQKISQAAYNTLKFLMTFLVLLTKNSTRNQMEPKALGIVFAPCLFRCAYGNSGLKQHSYTNHILKCFITNFDELFLAEGEESPYSPGYVLKNPMVRNRAAPFQPQSKVDPNTSTPVPPPRKRKPQAKLRETLSQQQFGVKDNTNVPIPVPRKNNVVVETIQIPEVCDNSSQNDEDLIDTNRSNSPFALESDYSEFSTAPSPRFPKAHDEIIEIVINNSVDEILFGERSSEIAKATPQPQPRQRRKQQVEVLENGYKMASIQERTAQMKENHMARRKDNNEVKKNTNAMGFQLFEDEGVMTSKDTTKPSVTAKYNGDDQSSCPSPTTVIRNPGHSKVIKDMPVTQTAHSTSYEAAADFFDLGCNNNKMTLHHPQMTRPAGPKRRNPTRQLMRKQAAESDLATGWTANTVKDHPPQPRLFLAETQNITSKPEVNRSTKPSMDFLSHREHVSPEKSIPLNTKPYVPPLDFSTLHEHGDGSDPIPAEQGFSISLQKANQCEDGETALLSPRTSKVRSRKIAHPNTDVPPSPPTDQTHIPSKPIIDDKASLIAKQLAKKIQSCKKHIKEFEERFEASHGYRPSQTDKAAVPEVKRNMQELQKTRKELRRVKEEIENERRASMPSPGARPNHNDDDDLLSSDRAPTMRETLQSLLTSLEQKRAEANRPEDLSKMSMEEVVDEKLAVQKALLHFESIHGRPATKEDKTLMRPLYDRYRNIKRILSKPQSPRDKSTELQSVPEGQPLEFTPSTTESTERDVVHVPTAEHVEEQEDFMVTREFNLMGHDMLPGAAAGIPDMLNICDGPSQNLHHLSRDELLEEQQRARAERKHLRNLLREYEDELYKQTGSKMQRKAQAPLQAEYKHVKERLKLLKALLSKHDSLSGN